MQRLPTMYSLVYKNGHSLWQESGPEHACMGCSGPFSACSVKIYRVMQKWLNGPFGTMSQKGAIDFIRYSTV